MDTAETPSTFTDESPISLKWTISEEKLTALKNSKNGRLETEWFYSSNIPDIQYYLRIYPNGNNEKSRGNVWIYLHLVFESEAAKIKTEVKYVIQSAGFSGNRNDVYDRSTGWGFKLCNTDQFFDPTKKFIVNGKFTLKCEGILNVEQELTDDEDDESEVNLVDEHIGHKLWRNDVSKDFTFKVGENSVKAHKCILVTLSLVFKEMFESDMKEPNQMVITEFPLKIVEIAIQLCYDAAAFNDLEMKDKTELLRFFDAYDIGDLKTRFEASLIEDVSTSTVCQLANCSTLSNASQLEEKCAEVITQCIKDGTPIADFDKLDNDFLRNAISNACCNISQT